MRHVFVLVISIFTFACTSARGGPDSFESRYESGRVWMRDSQTGRFVIDPRWPLVMSTDGSLPPDVQFQPRSDGFDIEVTYDNAGSGERHLADIWLDGFLFGEEAQWRDFNWMGELRTETKDAPPGWAYSYPAQLYSPTMVLESDEHIVGVSVMYPILRYKHDVSFAFRSTPNDPQRWHLRIIFSDPKGVGRALATAATLPERQLRTYRISVRVVRKPAEWLETLIPYRDYFRSLYGGVRYDRRNDAVLAVPVAAGQLISPENPRGWRVDPATGERPDLHGWQAWIATLLAETQYRRYMLWSPSGLYRDRSLNYPTQMCSPWLEDPELRTALDPHVGLRRLATAGRELGLWWGHSASYADRWDPSELLPLDVHDDEHVQAALQEVDIASAAGATAVGLDAFSHRNLRVWDAYWWLQRMQLRHPDMRFIIEPQTADLMHTLAPMYMRGWNEPRQADSRDDLNTISQPHLLADFLCPGHEIWLGLYWGMYERYLERPATPEEMRADVQRAAQFGFVPVVPVSAQMQSLPQAAESWQRTIPDNLKAEPAEPLETVDDPGDEELTEDMISRRHVRAWRVNNRGTTRVSGADDR